MINVKCMHSVKWERYKEPVASVVHGSIISNTALKIGPSLSSSHHWLVGSKCQHHCRHSTFRSPPFFSANPNALFCIFLLPLLPSGYGFQSADLCFMILVNLNLSPLNQSLAMKWWHLLSSAVGMLLTGVEVRYLMQPTDPNAHKSQEGSEMNGAGQV